VKKNKNQRRAAAVAWYANDGWPHCGATERTYLVKYCAAAASDRTGGAGPGTRSLKTTKYASGTTKVAPNSYCS